MPSEFLHLPLQLMSLLLFEMTSWLLMFLWGSLFLIFWFVWIFFCGRLTGMFKFVKGKRKKILKNCWLFMQKYFIRVKLSFISFSFFHINLFSEENVSFIYSIITLIWKTTYYSSSRALYFSRALQLTSL